MKAVVVTGPGALADHLVSRDAVRGFSFEAIPDHIPWEVAALDEPMAVARHGVNRCGPEAGETFRRSWRRTGVGRTPKGRRRRRIDR